MSESRAAGRVLVRPATPEDIASTALAYNMRSIPTMKAWVGEVDGVRVGVGGIWLLAGRWILFIDITAHGRALLGKNLYVRAALVRAAVTALREAKRIGIRFVYASAEQPYPRSEDLLLKLGFAVDHRAPGWYRWSSP